MTTPAPTTAPAATPAPVTGAVATVPAPLLFQPETVKRLNEGDFDLTDITSITLKFKGCCLVLFYIHNVESDQLANVWASAAQQIAGPTFAAIDMINNRKVAEAFTNLKMNGSHSLHWAALRQFPFILVYREGWPVACYNGPRETQAIIDYSLTLACQANYYEPLQEGGGAKVDKSIEMGPTDIYINTPSQANKVKQVSSQFTTENPVRGFNNTLPVSEVGSTQSQQSLEVIRQEQAKQQASLRQGVNASLTQTTEAPAVTAAPVSPGVITPAPTTQ